MVAPLNFLGGKINNFVNNVTNHVRHTLFLGILPSIISQFSSSMIFFLFFLYLFKMYLLEIVTTFCLKRSTLMILLHIIHRNSKRPHPHYVSYLASISLMKQISYLIYLRVLFGSKLWCKRIFTDTYIIYTCSKIF